MPEPPSDLWSGLIELLKAARERVDDPAISGVSVTFQRVEGALNIIASLTLATPPEPEEPTP